MATNAFLIRWAGGWAERIKVLNIFDIGRAEALLGLGAVDSLAEVYRVADGQLDEFARERVQTDVTIEPVGDPDTPYLGYMVGDSGTVAGDTHRLLGMAVTEDNDTGRASFVPSLNSDVVLDANERLFQAMRKMVVGTLGGRSKVAQPVVPMFIPRGNVADAPSLPLVGTWASRTAFTGTFAQFGFQTAFLGGFVYVMSRSALWRYSIAGNSWASLTGITGTSTGEWVSLVAHGGFLYAVVSLIASPGPRTKTWRYNPGTDSWVNTLTAMPVIQEAFNYAYLNGKIYCAGGKDVVTGGPDSAKLQVYDIAGNSWATKASTSSGHQLGGMAASGGLIYLWTKLAADANDKLHVYDPVANTWTAHAAPPWVALGVAENQWTNAAAFSDGVILVGGGNSVGSTLKFWLFDTATETYTAIPDAPSSFRLEDAVVVSATEAYLRRATNTDFYRLTRS